MNDIGSGLATLLGASLGAGVAFISMWLQFRHARRSWWDSTRKDSYARFLAASHAYSLALMDLRHALKRSHANVGDLYNQANKMRSELVMTMAELDLVARTSTKSAGHALMEYLTTTNQTLFDAMNNASGPGLPPFRDFDSQYQSVVAKFIAEATTDLSAWR